MAIQQVLFLIDEAFANYKKSKNIFMRRYSLNKQFKKIRNIITQRAKIVDYDLLMEFINIYNSTYEFIKVDTDTAKLKVINDDVLKLKYLSISISDSKDPFTIFIYLRNNKMVNITLRRDNNIIEAPKSFDFNDRVIYSGIDKAEKEIIDIVNSCISLFIGYYVTKYFYYKFKRR